MERIRIITDVSKHVGCGGLMAMSRKRQSTLWSTKDWRPQSPAWRWFAYVAEKEFARRTRWKHRTNSYHGWVPDL